MHRYLDVFFILLGVFVASFALTGLLVSSFAVKLAVSFFAALLASVLAALFVRGKNRNGTDYRSFVTYCILTEEDEVAKLFQKAGFIENCEIQDGFYKTKDGVACLFLKYSKPSRDYIVTMYKKCLKEGEKKITVWCAGFERAGVAVACNLPGVEFSFRTLRPLYKKLKKEGLLRGGEFSRKDRMPLKTLLPFVFSTKNSYRFAGASLLLYVLSLLTPLKAYYVAVATVALVLAVVSRIYGEKSDRSA